MFRGSRRRSRRLRALVTALLIAAGTGVVVTGQVASADPQPAAAGARGVPLPAGDGGAVPGPGWPAGDFGRTSTVATAAALPAPVLAAPDDGVLVAATRPELRVAPADQPVRYRFSIGSGGSPDTGQVATSGWISEPRWVVPAGVLADGGQYTWTAQLGDASGAAGPAAAPRGFTVNLRLGAPNPDGPVPADTLGPVTVNLATGNVTTSLRTPVVLTGFGPQLVQLTYNSLAATATGLAGSYFAGDSATGIADTERPVLVRTDRQVSFAWRAPGKLPPGVDSGAFRVRWQGYLRVPETGGYHLGGLHQSGLRVWVGDQIAYDGWAARPGQLGAAAFGDAVPLEAGKAYPVRVEYRSGGALSFVQLWARTDSGRAAPVGASWLSTTPSILPPGWTISPAPDGFVAASTTESGVTLTDAGGAATTFARSSDGRYRAGSGARSATLTRDAAGTFTATAASGITSVFAANGAVTSIRPGRPDPTATKRAAQAPVQVARAADARPTSVSAAGGQIQFYYAGSDKCADRSAPAGFLCAIGLADGSLSYLTYANGRLVRFRNPGDEITDLGFNAANQLTKVRPPLVMDWIGVDPRRRDSDQAAYLVRYQPDTGRAGALAGPEPDGYATAFPQRPEHGYTYTADSTDVQVADLRAARHITRDIGGRMLTDTDATNRTTRYVWAPTDQRLAKTDPAGRKTTTAFGPAGLGFYGPAPERCFAPDGNPVAPPPAGCERVPTQLMAMNGPTITMTTVESDGIPDKAVAMTLNQAGMPVSRVLDPAGLALATTTQYDDFFRPLSLSSPVGGSTTYTYYGPDDTAAPPCEPGSPAAPQRGRLKYNLTPAPATGSSRRDDFVYNARGFEVGMNFGTNDWVCAWYDQRNRTTRITIPGNSGGPARDTRYDFTPGGDPLSITGTDSAGTIKATSDLLGRTVSYTDVYGIRTRTSYDRAGRPAARTTILPDGASTTTHRRYDDAGRLLEVRLGDRTLATARYDAGGDLTGVTYANGVQLAVIQRDGAGRATGLDWRLADGRHVVSAATKTRAGTIVDDTLGGTDARPGAPNYAYDAAGRLTDAWVTGHHFGYDYTSAAASTCPAGTIADSGRNTNAARITDQTAAGTTATAYCYDGADRLLSATGAHPVTGVTYTEAGHTAGYTLDGNKIALSWDVAERYTGISVDGAQPAGVRYGYNVFDQVISRTVTGAGPAETELYGVNPVDPTETQTLGADRKLLSRTIALPGGVLYTAARGGDGWNHPDVRGNITLVTDARGGQVGDLYRYTPTGTPLTPDGRIDADHVPANQPGGNGYAWLGQYQKRYEHAGALSVTVMNLRPVDNVSGRFLAMGTVDNNPYDINYQYAQGDPVNNVDLLGFYPHQGSPDLSGLPNPIF